MSFPLNPAQQAAVSHFTGPVLVLAGAGSGKTRVITARICKLIERGVAPTSIVALTFTNKAAGEMRERVAHLLGPKAQKLAADLTISTFHSFGLFVLTREAKKKGGPFTIFDQGDQLALVKDLLANMRVGRTYDASAILARISNAKNAFISPDAYGPEEATDYEEITKLVYPQYEARLRSYRAYDFDDLVCTVARTWNENADSLATWQKRFRFLLVDEYQDTNRAQLELVKCLAGPDQNVCVVGDDDQSIYAWRGADVRNILDFEEEFKGAVVIKLEQNYRSRAPILAVANAVIEKRSDVRHRKVLFTARDGGAPVKLVIAGSPESEAKWVCRRIRTLIREEHVSPKEIAVLYRSNGQAKPVEENLREEGIAYRMVGGQQFFERKEVKDVLCYLKLAMNRSDEISLRRIVNYPARGIGDTSLERLSTHAHAKGWTLWQTIERLDAIDEIPTGARAGCKALERIMVDLRRRLLIERVPPSAATRSLCEDIGLRAELDSSSGSTSVSARRWSNVEGLLATLKKRETAGKIGDERALAAFIHALTLNSDQETEEPGNTVTLSTLHGSKGLEFDHVFLLGCEEGFLPHTRTTDGRATDIAPTVGVDSIEEERRLFYVGVTRAKEALTLSRCAHRVMRGKPMPRPASRFLSDIPEEMLVIESARDEAQSMEMMSQGAEGLLAALLADG